MNDMKKKHRLVFVVLYHGDILGVCETIQKARELCKQHVIDLDYKVDLFEVKELPLI